MHNVENSPEAVTCFTSYSPKEKPVEAEWSPGEALELAAAALELCSRIPDRTLARSTCVCNEGENNNNPPR